MWISDIVQCIEVALKKVSLIEPFSLIPGKINDIVNCKYLSWNEYLLHHTFQLGSKPF